MKTEERPRVLGLTASPILSINKAASYEKIKESFESLKKNLDSNFLEIDQSQIPSNESEVRPVPYGNDESIDLHEDRDLLELATISGYYKFFLDLNIEDFSYLKKLNGIDKIMVKKYQGKSVAMALVFNAAKKLLLENSIVILLELGKYPLYCQVLEFQKKLESVKHDEVYKDFESDDKELLNYLEELYRNFLKFIDFMKDERLISKKFKQLLEILRTSIESLESKNKEEQPRTMIFADTRFITKLISDYINKLGKDFHLSSQYITGRVDESTKLNQEKDSQEVLTIENIKDRLETLQGKSRPINQNIKGASKAFQATFSDPVRTIEQQLTLVQDFRNGVFNVLVSTSVTEEGFDTPACNVVVAYNEPDSLKSYIQMKGRARKENSTFYILVHKSKQDEWENMINNYKAAIDVMKKSAYDHSDTSFQPKLSKEEQRKVDLKNWLSKKPQNQKKEDLNYQYYITKSGYTMNTNWAVELIMLFCSKFRSDDLIDTKPRYHFLKIPSLGYLCCVMLPPIFKQKLQLIIGGFTPSKSEAKKLAAYKCCKRLYDEKLLTEDLKPARFSEIKAIDKLSIDRIFDFKDEKDSLITEKLAKILVTKIENSKQKCLYPLSTLNPFKFGYQKSKEDCFIGYLYGLEFSKILEDKNTKNFPKTSSLGFVYYNDSLRDVELKVELPFDDQATMKFRFIKKITFNRKEYKKYMLISRWLDAVVRSWDVNFFEMLLGEPTEKKSPLYKKRKNLSGIEMEETVLNEARDPIFPFYWILDQENNLHEGIIFKIEEYIEQMKQRYREMNAVSEEKLSVDRTYSHKFKQNPAEMSKVLVQSSITFNKYVIFDHKPIRGLDICDCKTDGMSLQLSLITIIEPHYDYVIQKDDYVLTMKSLGRFSQKLLKGEDHMNTHDLKAFKKDHFGVLGEFIEFPLELAFTMDLHQFKNSLVNLRDHLRVIHFRDTVLVDIEKKMQPSKKCTWEFANLEELDLPIEEISRVIEDKGSLNLIENSTFNDLLDNMPERNSIAYDVDDSNQSYAQGEIFSRSLPLQSLKLALTTKEYNNTQNYERKEMMGDAILKLLSTVEVFARLPTGTEYDLHMERTKIINNLNLFRHSIKFDLYEFILKRKKEEIPISYKKNEEVSKPENVHSLTVAKELAESQNREESKSEEDGKNDQEEAEEEKLVKIPSNYEEFHYKTIADVVESLVSVYYEHGGLKAAQRFLYSIGVLKFQDFAYNFANLPTLKPSKIESVRKMKKFVESKLNNGQIYRFKDPNLLLQAFCHITIKLKMQALFSQKNCSFLNLSSLTDIKSEETESLMETNNPIALENEVSRINELTSKITSNLSYERLEFLGDAILDYYVVLYIYEKYPKADPGEMTAMKSSVVNNHALSLICLKNEFDKLIISDISLFRETAAAVRQKFDIYWEDIDAYFDSNNYSFVKVTGDVIEALIGAIYLDSRQNIEVTFKVIDYLCGDLIKKYGDEKRWRNLPQYLLNEYCKKEGLSEPKIRRLEDTEIENKSGYAVYVLEVEGKVLAKYVAHTTSTHLIEKRLYQEAWKQIKTNKKD